MTLVLRMDLNNDAFMNRGRRPETSRILRELAQKIMTQPCKAGTCFALMDVNGNTVGAAKLFDEENEPEAQPALRNFLHVWCEDTLLYDIGPHLRCAECEVLAELLEENMRPGSAKVLREGHAIQDEAGDSETHLKLKAEIEKRHEQKP